ncbi:hypothetical protein [Nocardia sp. R6R-6]|uniref:hypothetical protein n=1 Tax=Nocardia sp. R6R-6 TaxID=3459303 RepID=UPI00403D6DF0
MMGKHLRTGLAQPERRGELTMAKAAELGIVVIERCMTVGRYDFCSLLEVPDVATATAFSHWFRRKDFGDSELLFILDDDEVKKTAELSTADVS